MDNNYQNNPQQPNQTNGMAIAALVCGIIGVVGCFFGWFAIASLVLSIVGIVLGAKGMQIAKTTGTGNGLAIAGLVCGIVGAAFSLVGAICFLACASASYAADGLLSGLYY